MRGVFSNENGITFFNDVPTHEPSLQTIGSSSLIPREYEYGLLCTFYQHVIRHVLNGKQDNRKVQL